MSQLAQLTLILISPRNLRPFFQPWHSSGARVHTGRGYKHRTSGVKKVIDFVEALS